MNAASGGDRNAIQAARYFNIMSKLHSGTYGDEGDVLDYPLYDEFQIAAATLVHHLFTNPIGGALARNYSQTNVQSANGMPQGNKFYCHALQLTYTAEEVRTEPEVQLIQEMLHNTTATFRIVGKDIYGIWPLDVLMGNALQTTALVATTPGLTGQARYTGIYPLNIPIVLASQVRFEVEIQHWVAADAGLANDWLRFTLVGILERLS